MSGFSDMGSKCYRADMPRGLVRWQRDGDLHFVTMSCDGRQPYLTQCFPLAVNALERTRRQYDMEVRGYVFMPEHIHLLVSEPTHGLLADALKMFKLSVTLRQPLRPFWEKRYHDRNIFTHNAMVECLRYLHRNPVERGLVKEPEDWPWSSYRHYYLHEKSSVTLDSEWARVEARWSPASEG